MGIIFHNVLVEKWKTYFQVKNFGHVYVPNVGSGKTKYETKNKKSENFSKMKH